MTNERLPGEPQSNQTPRLIQPNAEALLASDNFDIHSDYDPEHERQVLAEIEAERAGQGGAPTGLLALMLAPLLLVALPLMLLWFLRATPATTPVATAPNPVVSDQSPAVSSASPIVWQTSLNDALALAKQSGKPLMVDFYADWCGPCKMLDQYTWPDPAVAQEAQNVIAVKVNVDNDTEAARRYSIGPIPCIIWMDSNGGEKGRTTGFLGPQEMLPLMQQYR
jgi:thiol:disulfide interchange protein DsbD